MKPGVSSGPRSPRHRLGGLKRVLAGLLLSLSIALAALAWLVLSRSGADLTIETAERWLDGRLSVASVSGRLVGPLEVQGLRYADGGTEVTVSAARLRWQPLALLRGQVRIVSLEAGEVDLRQTASAPSPPEEASATISDRLPLGLVIRRLEVQRLSVHQGAEAAPLVIDAIALSGRWVGSRIQIESLTAEHALSGPVQIAAGLLLSPEQLAVENLTLSGPAEARLQGVWALNGVDASNLRLSWTRLQWPLAGTRPAPEPGNEAELPLIDSRSGSLAVAGTLADLKLELDASLSGGARLSGEGRWLRSEGGALEAELEWENLGYPLTNPSAAYRLAEGKVSVEGLPEAYRFQLETEGLVAAPAQTQAQAQATEVAADSAATPEIPAPTIAFTLNAAGQGNLEGIRLERLGLMAEGAQLEASGNLVWEPQLSATLAGTLTGLNPGRFVAGWEGEIDSRFQVRGSRGAESEADFKLSIINSQLRGKPLAAELQGRWGAGVLELAPSVVSSEATRLSASGRAWPDLELALALDSPDLQDLWPELLGSASLRAQLDGSLQTPRVRLSGQVDSASFAGQSLDSARIEADLDLSGPLKLDMELLGWDSGTRIERASLNLDGTLAEHRLELAALGKPGELRMMMEGAFDRQSERWQGQWASASLTPAGLLPWSLEAPARLSLDAQRLSLAPACLISSERRLCVELDRDGGLIEAEIDLRNFDFAYLDSLWPEGTTSTGALSGNLRVRLSDGQLEDLGLNLDSTPGSLTLANGRTLGFGALEALVSEAGDTGIARLRLPFDAGRLVLDAGYSSAEPWPQRTLSGELRFIIPDLAVLSELTPEVRSASGRLSGRFALGGTIGEPSLDGLARLEDGQLALATPGIQLDGFELRLQSRGLERLDLSGSVTSGGGELALRGVVESGPTLDLALTGREFQVADITQARVWISPDLRLIVAEGEALLTGTLDVPRASLRPEGLEGGVAPNRDQVIVDPDAESEAVIALRSDVQVTLGPEVRFEGFGLSTGLGGSLRIVEEPGRETSRRGVVSLKDGLYKAYGQQLKIETGRLLFEGGPIDQPAVELRATREPRDDIKVGVQVRGTLEAPEFNLFSEPSMPQQEQLSWLILGRPLESAGGSDDRSLLAGAALSLGVGGSNLLAQNLKKGLGLDDISIGADPGEDTGAARFTVGKYLSPKLYVSYGVGLFLPGSRVKMTYDLGRGFKLSSESGVDTGADLLYSWERD